jgi:hypothetical protein
MNNSSLPHITQSTSVNLSNRSAMTATSASEHQHSYKPVLQMMPISATVTETRKETKPQPLLLPHPKPSTSLMTTTPDFASSNSSSPSFLKSSSSSNPQLKSRLAAPSPSLKPATAATTAPVGPSANPKPIMPRPKRASAKFNPSDYPINYPVYTLSPEAIASIPSDQRAMLPRAGDILTKRYATSVDPRNFLTVYEYSNINGQPILWDYTTGYVHITGLWKATGHTKADIVKLIDNSPPEIEQLIRRVRGGFLKIQGTWLPFDIAKRLAQRTCWFIRYALVPVFGPAFPDECLTPETPGFGQLLLVSSPIKASRRSVTATGSATTTPAERKRKRSATSDAASSGPAEKPKQLKASPPTAHLYHDYLNRPIKGAASPVTMSQRTQVASAFANKKPKKKNLNPPPLISPLTAHALLAPAHMVTEQNLLAPLTAPHTAGVISNTTPPTPPHDDNYQSKSFYGYSSYGGMMGAAFSPTGFAGGVSTEASAGDVPGYDSDEEVLNATRCLQMLSRHAHHDYYYRTGKNNIIAYCSPSISNVAITTPPRPAFVPVVDNGFALGERADPRKKISVSSLLS